MTVDNQADSKDSVEERVVGATSNERSGGHRDQGSRQETLECPVVRAVDARRWRECRWVVHSALVDGCERREFSLCASSIELNSERLRTTARNVCRVRVRLPHCLHTVRATRGNRVDQEETRAQRGSLEHG